MKKELCDMAKPRIFVSSTYYDLKHLRSAFESFLDQFGFEAVLSEKGNIAYTPDMPLDASCYREVEQVDIFILILGGRYGSEQSFGESAKEKNAKKAFYENYDSITREEFRAAIKNDIPTYILIERSVYDEYQTFVKNRDSSEIHYAHVDSANIFRMIDEIVSLPRNNPILQFDRYHEIENWLREQWAGLFKELLRRASAQSKISSLADQVTQLSETNKTLRKYIESIMTHVAPESKGLITSESKRLDEVNLINKLRGSNLVGFLVGKDLDMEEIAKLIIEAKSLKDLFEEVGKRTDDPEILRNLKTVLDSRPVSILTDLNQARATLGMEPLLWGQGKRSVSKKK